ncbi:MAG: PAS domain S-box protein [Nitrosospira sp.]|nr:PAS domain S-box protein [Nitrosospira sp.]
MPLKLLADVLNAASEVAIIAADPAGTITVFNRGAERLLGYEAGEMVGKQTPAIFHLPAEVEARARELSVSLGYPVTGFRTFVDVPERQGSESREWTYVRKSGEHILVSLVITAIRADDGEINGYLGIAHDITERKQAEEALRSNEERLRTIVDALPNAMLMVSAEGRIAMVNSQAEHIFGYRREELLGQPIEMLVPQQYHGKHAGYRTAYTHAPDTREMGAGREIYGQHKDGKVFPVEIGLNPVQTPEGRFVLASVIDITERKKVEEELSQFKYTLDQTLDSVFMFREGDFRFIYVNNGAQEQVGYTEAELLAMTPLDIKPEFTLERFRQTVQPLIDGTQASLNFQTIHRHKDGHNIPVEIFLQFIREGIQQGRFVAIVRDITERKRIERMKNEFVSTVSHELRTPLTSIAGSLGLLVGGALGSIPQNMRALIDIAHKNSQRLNHLINDLLDMEKIAAGKMHFDIQLQPLLPLIEQVLENTRGYGVERRVTLALISQAADAEVRVDGQRLLQVLSNLLSNAIKYSPEDGTVEVTVQKLDGRVRISVTDHGPGIPAAFRAHIFQKFSQADSSDTRQKGGTGLGLAITRELVEHMHGQVGFESEEGKGATFFCELPLANAAATGITSHMPSLSGSDAPRILVVEDEPDIAQLLSLLLSRAGYQVDIAANGAEALQALQQSSYAAMTLDLRLPDSNGLEIIRQVRQRPETVDLPIIVVSAGMEEGKLAINGDFSNIDWLTKPIDETRLLGTVEKYLVGVAGHRPRVLHVEDDADLHQVIRAMVGECYDFELATTLADARAMIALERFDVVILDLELPDGSGWDLLPLLKKQKPAPRIIILSGTELSSTEAGKVEAALLKSRVSPHELLDAINTSINSFKSGGKKP